MTFNVFQTQSSPTHILNWQLVLENSWVENKKLSSYCKDLVAIKLNEKQSLSLSRLAPRAQERFFYGTEHNNHGPLIMTVHLMAVGNPWDPASFVCSRLSLLCATLRMVIYVLMNLNYGLFV